MITVTPSIFNPMECWVNTRFEPVHCAYLRLVGGARNGQDVLFYVGQDVPPHGKVRLGGVVVPGRAT